VLRLSFRREESGLMASILFHHKHCMLDYIYLPLVYKIVPKLRFNKEKSGLLSCILYHDKLCLLDFIYPCVQGSAKAEL
jgi:hypothetical protein